MIKTYIAGILLGAAACIAVLHYVPAVDLDREASIIAVAPNGGNSETFHVNIPADRIMLGAEGRKVPLPAGMAWPESETLRGMRSELFKVRDAHDAVIGVASRVAIQNTQLGDVIEWVLHFPARGTLYATFETGGAAAPRQGGLRAGTREFAELGGSLAERWIADKEADAPGTGRIDLVATYVAAARTAPAETTP